MNVFFSGPNHTLSNSSHIKMNKILMLFPQTTVKTINQLRLTEFQHVIDSHGKWKENQRVHLSVMFPSLLIGAGADK